MQKYGYRPRDTYGIIAAGGTLGILIPPSGPMILYAIVSDASIGALFLTGLIPGLIVAAIFAVFSWVQANAHGETQKQDWVGAPEVLRALRRSIWAVLMPPVIMGRQHRRVCGQCQPHLAAPEIDRDAARHLAAGGVIGGGCGAQRGLRRLERKAGQGGGQVLGHAGTTSGAPVTGSAITSARSPKAACSASGVSTSAGGPSASTRPAAISTR